MHNPNTGDRNRKIDIEIRCGLGEALVQTPGNNRGLRQEASGEWGSLFRTLYHSYTLDLYPGHFHVKV